MYNPRSKAVSIEHTLSNKGLAQLGDAGKIERDPLAYLDKVLRIFEKQSEERETRAADFWDKFEDLQGVPLRNWEEPRADQLVKEVRALFE